jgi:hypothetical protein
MTTVGLTDTFTYTTTELVSCLVAPSARAWRSWVRFIRSASATRFIFQALNPHDRSNWSSLTSTNISLVTSLQLHTRKVASSIPAGTTRSEHYWPIYAQPLHNIPGFRPPTPLSARITSGSNPRHGEDVGRGGWAAVEIGRRYIDDPLGRQTTGNVRTVADVMVAQAEARLHQWLNLTPGRRWRAGGVRCDPHDDRRRAEVMTG